MSIQKKFFSILITSLGIVLLLMYIFVYLLFQQTITKQVIASQESTIMINQNLVTSFMNSIRQIGLHFTSDEACGIYLSTTPTDILQGINLKASLSKQFYHYSSFQLESDYNISSNILFLNDQLPLSTYFEDRNLENNTYNSVSSIFRNTLVSHTDWYERTIYSPNFSYVFYNQETNQFHIAQKVMNNYYTGPYFKEGLGVILTTINMNYLDELFKTQPITSNSGYAILNSDYSIIYTSLDTSRTLYHDVYHELIRLDAPEQVSTLITIHNERYFANFTNSSHGLILLFLTPYSDINNLLESISESFFMFGFAFMIALITIVFFATRYITKPIITLADHINRISQKRNFQNHSLQPAKDLELQLLTESFLSLIHEVNYLIKEHSEQSQHQKEIELKALQAQINPHFIFNTMDIVNWLALSKGEDEIASIVDSIANLMRYSITNPDDIVPIQDELLHIQEFIKIYQLRHDGIITLNIQEESLKHCHIPKFILQPLIENSIRHGMLSSHTPLLIHIYGVSHVDHFTIFVTDNGCGCDTGILNEYLLYISDNLQVTNGFGIRNVNDRLQLKYGMQGHLSFFMNDTNQLTARIQLPPLSYHP
ncbi:MAG: histidine kinase [Eubacteriales bacterium]